MSESSGGSSIDPTQVAYLQLQYDQTASFISGLQANGLGADVAASMQAAMNDAIGAGMSGPEIAANAMAGATGPGAMEFGGALGLAHEVVDFLNGVSNMMQGNLGQTELNVGSPASDFMGANVSAPDFMGAGTPNSNEIGFSMGRD